jgi:hypothetical protein
MVSTDVSEEPAASSRRDTDRLLSSYSSDCDPPILRTFEISRVLVRKPEGTISLGRPRRRWEDNIKRDLQEVGGGDGTGWSGLRIGTVGGHL